MIEKSMTCEDCDELFLDYFEKQLDGERRSKFDEHVATCVRCQSLIRDIEGIRNQAADLPELAPARDLWIGIEARIQPEVRSIATARPTSISRTWLAAAAAALVVATSGVTYFATSRSMTRPLPGKAATITVAPQVAEAVRETPAASEPAPVSSAASPEPAATARPASPSIVRSAPRSSLASTSAIPMPPTASELAFSGEIKQLQTVLTERRSQLDPETVKVVEDNLKLIDTAVKRARSALTKDPASGLLMRQLDMALQKKVELLRTVALLPAST